MKKISENGYSLEDLLKNVIDETFIPNFNRRSYGGEILNEDEILVALVKGSWYG